MAEKYSNLFKKRTVLHKNTVKACIVTVTTQNQPNQSAMYSLFDY